MRVEIDDKSGFCFGVVKTITTAEELLSGGEKVYSLGDIVHNRVEVQRLEELGLMTLRRDEFEGMQGGAIVLIRAHGEPPTTYSKARERGIRLVDATCRVVERLQGLVREAHQQMMAVGGTVVILGKKGHAEVVGLAGQVDGDVVVVEGMEDLDEINFEAPISLLSQTTQSLSLFESVKEEILARATDAQSVVVNDTICRQVANREPHLREFAGRFDVVIFVSGRKSSNGKVLFEACRSANPRSYMVEEAADIEEQWLEGAQSVGVCGATSTPKWLMESVASSLRANRNA